MITEMAALPGNPRPTVEGTITHIARGTPVHLEMVMEDDRLAIRVVKVSR